MILFTYFDHDQPFRRRKRYARLSHRSCVHADDTAASAHRVEPRNRNPVVSRNSIPRASKAKRTALTFGLCIGGTASNFSARAMVDGETSERRDNSSAVQFKSARAARIWAPVIGAAAPLTAGILAIVLVVLWPIPGSAIISRSPHTHNRKVDFLGPACVGPCLAGETNHRA
jgi:hypothetical protein